MDNRYNTEHDCFEIPILFLLILLLMLWRNISHTMPFNLILLLLSYRKIITYS